MLEISGAGNRVRRIDLFDAFHAPRFVYSSRQSFNEVMSAKRSSGFGNSTGDSAGCECSNPEYLVMSESSRLQSSPFNLARSLSFKVWTGRWNL